MRNHRDHLLAALLAAAVAACGGSAAQTAALACAAPATACGSACVDVAASTASCGACGAACSSANGVASCAGGDCQIVCAVGFADCDGDARKSGCETDTRTDPLHCGACGNACDLPRAVPSCGGGACAIGACAAGWGDCDGLADNGCETDLSSSPAHCGACGAACSGAGGASSCAAGHCAILCDGGFADCNGNARGDGCEVDLRADPRHCGGCGLACSTEHGAASCADALCQIACDAGWGDCDFVRGNGCETDVSTSTAHCGACFARCSTANGTASCVASSCRISCMPGFEDCDGNSRMNGCEVDLRTNRENCGQCGSACGAANAETHCTSGACTSARCVSGFADCNGMEADGCEVDLRTNPASCGFCANACPAESPSCVARTCRAACGAGRGDCDADPANGCETDLATAAESCGACAASCTAPGGLACAAGACQVACPAGATAAATTNHVTRSQQLGAWAPAGLSTTAAVLSDVAVAPDGTATAEKLRESGIIGQHRLSRATLVPAGLVTFSVFGKPAERSWVWLRVGATNGAYVDLASCTTGTTTGSAIVGVRLAPDGWCRAWVTTTAAGNDLVYLSAVQADALPTHQGTEGAGLFLWGAQLEPGGAATPYLATGTATAARGAGCYADPLRAGPDLFRMDAVVAADGADGSIQRIPALTKVRDGRLLLVWEQIRKPVAHDGEGVRLVQAFVDYDLAAGSLVVGPVSPFEEPAAWSSGLGAAMHPLLVTLPSGRIVCVYNLNDEPSGIIENRILSMYERHSDDGGVTWSARQRLVDAAGSPIGSFGRASSTGATGAIARIPAGPHAGRLVAPGVDAVGGPIYAVTSDDDGETWTRREGFLTPELLFGTESSVVWRNDGTLLLSFRTEGAFALPWATSDDGGESWTFGGVRSDWQSSNCASAMEEAWEEGGPDLLLWSGLDNATTYLRRGIVLRLSFDGISYHQEYRPVSASRAAGYSSVRMLDATRFAVAWESGFNSRSALMLYVTSLPEVYRSGVPHP